MSKNYHRLAGAISIAASIAFATPAGAARAIYWGPNGGVAVVHTPGPYVRPPVYGLCCSPPWRSRAVAVGVAAYPYPSYGYPYPVYVPPRPIVYPPAVIIAPAPAYVYPGHPIP